MIRAAGSSGKACPKCGSGWTEAGPGGKKCAAGHWLPRSVAAAGSGRSKGGTSPAFAANAANAALAADGTGATGGPTPGTKPVLKPLSDVTAEVVRWLWPGRIPLGKLIILDGDPGLGKSVLTLDLGARVSRGLPMPDGSAGELDGAAGVVLMADEDGLGDTIRPRLDAAGADPSRIHALKAVVEIKTKIIDKEPIEETTRRPPTIGDIDQIRDAIRQTDARLVIIDPLMAHLPVRAESNSDPSMRRALAPLAELAENTGAAILLVRHLNKMPGGNPLYRGGGSIGIVGAARSGLLVACDPDDGGGTRRVLASTKSNLSRPPASLAYEVVTADNGAARIVWRGKTSQTAKTLLAAEADAAEDRGALSDAKQFLRQALREGEWPADEVQAEARKQGISVKLLRKARNELGGRTRRGGTARRDDGSGACRLRRGRGPTIA